MKRYMAILGFVFVGILAGLLVRGIPIVLHVNAVGEIPRGSQNGDVNGDSMLDMSDAVYLLIHLFNGGPEPIACADSDEIWDEVRAIEGEIEGLGGPLARIAESLAYESCKNRHDRFVDHGDQTVTDRLTRLMWARNGGSSNTWDGARVDAAESSHAGHTDWRLPTVMELLSIRREMPIKAAHHRTSPQYYSLMCESKNMMYPAFPWQPEVVWSSTDFQEGEGALVLSFRSGAWVGNTEVMDNFQDRRVSKGDHFSALMVRDIPPAE